MLLGTSKDADLVIEKSILSLIEDRTAYEHAADKQIYLFKLFVSCLPATHSIGALNASGSKGARVLREKYLPDLSWHELQVFLLLFIEEFSVLATAEIMGVSEQRVVDLQQNAEFKAHSALLRKR